VDFFGLSFEVGEEERHRVVISFNPIFFWLSVEVDGESVRCGPIFMWPRLVPRLVERFKFTVGYDEKHEVNIACKIPFFLPQFRRLSWQVHVDGELVEQRGPDADFSRASPLWFRILGYAVLVVSISLLAAGCFLALSTMR
jgi:hypothetical protein